MMKDMEDLQRFKAWLEQQPASRLADWLVEAGLAHRPLGIALNAEWGSEAGGRWDPGPVREAIRRLAEVPDMASWRDSNAIGNTPAPIGCLLRHVLEDQHAAETVALAEHALERIAELSMATQDSEEWSIPLLDEVGELHRKACLEAKPDPVPLARRWRVFQKRWCFGVFGRFPSAYEQVLGVDGLNEWHRVEKDPR